MTQSKPKKVILENDPLYKEKKEWSNRFAFLYGKKIVGVRYLTEEETEASGWYSAPIVIELSDGSALIPQSDDEGNESGSICVINNEELSTIPVMRDR